MKELLYKIIAGIVAFVLLASTLVFIGLILLALALSYFALVALTHHLIPNLWISVPIDICILGVIYSVMKISREYHTK